MFKLLALPFKLAGEIIGAVFSFIGGIFSMVFGLVGGLMSLVVHGACAMLIVGLVVAAVRKHRSRRDLEDEDEDDGESDEDFISYYDKNAVK